jgi:hypothetical protein
MSRWTEDAEGDIYFDEDIGVLHYGKMFIYSEKETFAGKGQHQRGFEESDPYVVLYITPYDERKRKEKYPHYCPLEEGILSHIGISVEPMTPCASLRIESGIEACSR